jgi:TRAP-type C4-dicarboxylate transport system substrate-binding protein
MKENRCIYSFVMFFLGIILFASNASASPIELSFSLNIPSRHLRYINVIEPWIKRIEAQTHGKVKITPYFSAALNTYGEAFDAAQSGVADITEGITWLVSGRFPLTGSVQLPGLGLNSSWDSSRAIWHVFNTVPEVRAEFAGVKVLWLYTTPSSKIGTVKKPVRTLEDLQGLKIRVTGPLAATTGKALGFAPVSMPMGDLYLSLEKGVLDGAKVFDEVLVSRRLGEVLNYVTDFNLGPTVFFVIMNQQKWDSFSPDVKNVFKKLTGDWAVEFGSKAWDKFDKEAREKMKAKGIQYISLPPKEEAKWQKRLTPIKEQYAEKLQSKKLPGLEVIDLLEQLAKTY